MRGVGLLIHGRRWRAVAITLLLGANLRADELTMTEAVSVVGERTRLFMGSFHCDEDSNVFYIPTVPYTDTVSTVVKVAADGKKVTRFTLDSVPGFREDARVLTIALGPGGELYVLAGSSTAGLAILAFEGDGEYRSRLELGDREIKQFAVFRSGEFLASGRVSGRPWVGILSAGGREEKALLERDPATSKMGTMISRHDLVDLTVATPGQDGRVYLARPTAKGPIFAVSAAGELTERIQVTPPTPDSRVFSIKASTGRLAVEHIAPAVAPGKSTRRSVSSYDLSSGERIATYVNTPGALLCYEARAGLPDSFVFLGRDKNDQVQLVRGSGSY